MVQHSFQLAPGETRDEEYVTFALINSFGPTIPQVVLWGRTYPPLTPRLGEATWIEYDIFVGSVQYVQVQILKHKRYYFKSSEPNRTKVAAGDRVISREYRTGLWGLCEISGDWTNDPEAKRKYGTEAGWFPIAKVHKWETTLPYELVKEDLSNQNHRLRIAKANEEDFSTIPLALRVYRGVVALPRMASSFRSIGFRNLPPAGLTEFGGPEPRPHRSR